MKGRKSRRRRVELRRRADRSDDKQQAAANAAQSVRRGDICCVRREAVSMVRPGRMRTIAHRQIAHPIDRGRRARCNPRPPRPDSPCALCTVRTVSRELSRFSSVCRRDPGVRSVCRTPHVRAHAAATSCSTLDDGASEDASPCGADARHAWGEAHISVSHQTVQIDRPISSQ